MGQVNIFIRFDERNVVLDKAATLTQEGSLIYNDETNGKTLWKFTVLTAASPLIAIARLVRSAVFLLTEDFERAGREFIGSLGVSVLASSLFAGTLLSSIISVISGGEITFHENMRRTYAYFEAWVNHIDLDAPFLPTFSHRVSDAVNCFGNEEHDRVWTTAPCMQPVLENGRSQHGGLLDPNRMKRLFPFVPVEDVVEEDGEIVIQSRYENERIHYVACNGAFEHAKTTDTFECCCCCAYRIEQVYDRLLCCEVSRGTCRSMEDAGDACGIVSCGACGVAACCCYEKEDNNIVAMNTGCFGPFGIYVTGFERTAANTV